MQFAGIDFPSRFDNDNFTSRRTTGHNMFDPESLISGKELAQGMTYQNSKRGWHNEKWYLAAVSGDLTTDEILEIAPRVWSLHLGNPKARTFIPNRLEQFQEMLDGE